MLIAWVLRALVIMVASYLMTTKVDIYSFWAALAVALFLAVANTVLKPILILLTLPINVLTLGLFTLIINALLIWVVSLIVPDFAIVNFWWAIIFGIVVSVLNSLLHIFYKQ